MCPDLWAKWQQTHTELEPEAEWLAKGGWTLPLRKDPNIMRRLRAASGDVDTAFIRYYTSNHSAELNAIWTDLLSSPGLSRWHLLLDEAISSYRDRRYAVVVPALLLVVEGAVAHGAADLRQRITTPKKSAGRKRADTDAGMRRLIWTSIDTFLQSVFGNAPFDQPRPVTLNRHWILHGRDSRTWARRKDCIRLFHALHTISAVVNLPR